MAYLWGECIFICQKKKSSNIYNSENEYFTELIFENLAKCNNTVDRD